MPEKIRHIVVVNFDKFNPPSKAVNKEVRDGGPLKWVRWESRGHRDPDILDLPREERWIWPTLIDLSAEKFRIDGVRVVHASAAHIAREADLTLEQAVHALDHLWKRKRIRYTRGGAKVVECEKGGGE